LLLINGDVLYAGSVKKMYYYVVMMYMWDIFLLVCYTVFILFLYHSFFIKINPLWVLFDSLFNSSKREQDKYDPNSIEYHNTKYKEILNQITSIIENNFNKNAVEKIPQNDYLSIHEREQMKTEMRETIASFLSQIN